MDGFPEGILVHGLAMVALVAPERIEIRLHCDASAGHHIVHHYALASGPLNIFVERLNTLVDVVREKVLIRLSAKRIEMIFRVIASDFTIAKK